jgi:hypothetical protein
LSRVDVNKAKAALNTRNLDYPDGCTEYVAKLLGKDTKWSGEWKTGPCIGKDYSSL